MIAPKSTFPPETNLNQTTIHHHLHRAKRVKRGFPKKPLIVIINSLHLLRDDEAGSALLEMLQQKAETWAEAGIIIMLNRYLSSGGSAANEAMTIGFTSD